MGEMSAFEAMLRDREKNAYGRWHLPWESSWWDVSRDQAGLSLDDLRPTLRKIDKLHGESNFVLFAGINYRSGWVDDVAGGSIQSVMRRASRITRDIRAFVPADCVEFADVIGRQVRIVAAARAVNHIEGVFTTRGTRHAALTKALRRDRETEFLGAVAWHFRDIEISRPAPFIEALLACLGGMLSNDGKDDRWRIQKRLRRLQPITPDTDGELLSLLSAYHRAHTAAGVACGRVCARLDEALSKTTAVEYRCGSEM
jgi:hypothetical protein